MDYVMGLDLFDFIHLLNKAIEKTNKEEEKRIESLLWQKWIIEWQTMTKDNFISFDDYKAKAFGRNINKNTNAKIDTDKILREAEAIKNADQQNLIK